MGDISFATPDEMAQIMDVIHNHPKTTFMIQSKRQEAYLYGRIHPYPDNCIFGTTLETNYNTSRFSKAPLPILRELWMALSHAHSRKYVTIEPIMEFDLDVMVSWIQEINPEFVYVGYNNLDSKNLHLPEPSLEKTLKLIEELEQFTEVRLKTLRKAWWQSEAEKNDGRPFLHVATSEEKGSQNERR